MPLRNTIQQLITNAGLTIVASKLVTIDEFAIEQLYRQVSADLLTIMRSELLHKSCEMGIVEGEQAVRVLLALCGHKTNPQKCKDGTIRKMLGANLEAIVLGRATYYKNVIHRSRTLREAECDEYLYDLM